ncbi:MAG: retron St85 family effector protein [Lachnospiraceae bacterium]|nr:retron St85 family effector protein [Lachnospiraceae bacterium]
MEEQNTELNKAICKIVEDIYGQIYCKFREQYIVVFLCGGASNKKYTSLRDKVRILLENEKKTLWYKPFKIFYPEDLLIEILNKTKEADLLSYEQFLASNSHMIVIICESAGSLVELGAFTNNEYTVDKVIAAVDKKLAKHKSFIMLGPIKYLKKKNKLNVIEYGQDEEDFARRLSKDVREKNKSSGNKNTMIDLTTIVGMHYFIQLILYFFKSLNSKELVEIVGYISEKEKIVYDDFKVLFNASLKLLFQDKKIVKNIGEQYSSYKLTDIGFETMQLMINDCTKAGLCDRIRVELMHYEFYKSSHS